VREAQNVYPGFTTRMCSSRSCFGETSDGAPIIRSSARWFIGNSTTFAQVLLVAHLHDDAIDAPRAAIIWLRERAISANRPTRRYSLGS